MIANQGIATRSLKGNYIYSSHPSSPSAGILTGLPLALVAGLAFSEVNYLDVLSMISLVDTKLNHITG